MITQNEIDNGTEEFFCSDCGERIGPADARCPKCGAEFIEDEKFISVEIEQGRKLARIIIGTSITILILTGIFNLMKFDGHSLLFLIHLGLLIVLFRAFYQGIKGAKYIMIALFGIAGLYGAFLGLLYMSKHWLGMLFLLLGLLYIGFSVLLIISQPIKLFQEYQKENQIDE